MAKFSNKQINFNANFKSSFWEIIFPLILVIGGSIFLIGLILSRSTGNLPLWSNWVNTSIILMSFFLLFFGVLLLVLNIAIILLLVKMRSALSIHLVKIQIFTQKAFKFLRSISKIALLPFTLGVIIKQQVKK